MLRSKFLPYLLRSYHGATSMAAGGSRVIDLRSDVLTQPDEGMREAIIDATYNDDVFNEDSTVHST